MDTMNELLPEQKDRILTTSSLLKLGDQYYKTQIFIPDFYRGGKFNYNNFKISETIDLSEKRRFTLSKGIVLDPEIAYLIGEFYYFFKGKINSSTNIDKLSPGIYMIDETNEYFIKTPITDEELEYYKYADKITRRDADEIRKAVVNHEVIIFNTPDSAHSNIPPESLDDDILKKLIKRAIKIKGIDLDQYKVRFASKNMLFNTKQVLRGPNRLSMLLFDRCAEALNLKYTIIVEEAGGEIVGMPMGDAMILSSEDVYDANLGSTEIDEE